MSTVTSTDTTPIESRAQLLQPFIDGCKSKDNFRIGTEHEKFVLNTATYKVVPYEGPSGIRALLEGMQRFGFAPIMEGPHIIALTRKTPYGDENISLEPAGQFELSGAPVKTLHEMSAELDTHFEESLQVARELGLCFLPIGMHPTAKGGELPWVPKGRYRLMRDYLPKVGTRGLDMMQLCCTTQVNLDYSTEADMVRKMRVGLAVQPVAAALFAYSPFKEGKQSIIGNRYGNWLDVDNTRAGIPAFAFEDGFGFERWVDFVLDVPMFFVKRGDDYLDATGMSFRDFMAGKLPLLMGEKPTMADWLGHLTTIMTDVRLKGFLEMRGADVGPPDMIKALPAFWTGLLYDDTSLNHCEAMIKEWTLENIHAMRRDVPRLGLSTIMGKQSLFNIAKQLVTWSVQGLRRRVFRDNGGADETRYLEPLLTITDVEQTEAERLLGLYNGAWDEKIDPLFDALCIK